MTIANHTGAVGELGIQARSLTLGYDARSAISADLDLDIEAGSFVAIVGPNACGKSTLLRAIARLIEPRDGQVLLDGRDIASRGSKELAREIGLLAQTAVVPEGMRVGELVARGRYPHRRPFTAWSTTDEAVVRRAMAATDVTDLADRIVDELSGGQRQRVWVALALAQDTRTLLLDEPTTYLDISHQLEILDLFRAINRRQGRTIVAVLHDLNQAARYADRIVAMRDGNIVAQGSPAEVVTTEVIEAVFDLPCHIITDPVSGTPLVVPLMRPEPMLDLD
ncbi:ABC transporter ATP-binding protein [Plantibacter flavus]|uniref:ABC transporter ATP-binding protein n=1 Tax=Plantibacter flavus TaxID=150123 RepID=UPI003F5CF5AB